MSLCFLFVTRLTAMTTVLHFKGGTNGCKKPTPFIPKPKANPQSFSSFWHLWPTVVTESFECISHCGLCCSWHASSQPSASTLAASSPTLGHYYYHCYKPCNWAIEMQRRCWEEICILKKVEEEMHHSIFEQRKKNLLISSFWLSIKFRTKMTHLNFPGDNFAIFRKRKQIYEGWVRVFGDQSATYASLLLTSQEI